MEFEKINKTKLVVIIIIALVVIAAITIGIISLVGKNKEDPFANAGSISKTESEFEELQIKDLELKYVEEKNETVLKFTIENKTDEAIEQQEIKIQLLNENEQLISSLKTDVSTIDPKGSHRIDITLGGNIQGIKKIKLVKPEQPVETPTQ